MKMLNEAERKKKETKLHQKDKPSVMCVLTMLIPMLNREKFPFFFLLSLCSKANGCAYVWQSGPEKWTKTAIDK